MLLLPLVKIRIHDQSVSARKETKQFVIVKKIVGIN